MLKLLLTRHFLFCVFVGIGATWLGSHTAQRTSSAFSPRRHNTRQDHGGQPVMGRRENCHHHLQVSTVPIHLNERFLNLREAREYQLFHCPQNSTAVKPANGVLPQAATSIMLLAEYKHCILNLLKWTSLLSRHSGPEGTRLLEVPLYYQIVWEYL